MQTISTIDPAEVEKFSRLAADWWDPAGPFKPLHRLNPVRLSYIRARAIAHFGRDSRAVSPLGGLTALDIGCGGGLVAEPLAMMGATVTAVDADAEAIQAARAHAAARASDARYQVGGIEEVVGTGARFDLVLALEIIEHVADRAMFLSALAAVVAPGGLLILSTLNRTVQSMVLGIGVAEHVLRWVEPGTHDWRKFVRPSELARGLRQSGFELADLTGLVFDPGKGKFRLQPDNVGVNYFAAATRSG